MSITRLDLAQRIYCHKIENMLIKYDAAGKMTASQVNDLKRLWAQSYEIAGIVMEVLDEGANGGSRSR